MSYILDALKKADAEREQGGVPGLHSRPQAPAPGDDDEEPKGRTMPIIWVGAGAALCLIGVLSWQLLSRETPPAQASAPALPQVPGQAMPEVTAQAPVPAPVALPAAPPVMAQPSERSAANVPAPAPARTPTQTPDAVANAPRVSAAPVRQPPPASPPPQAARVTAAPPPPPPPAQPAPQATAQPPVQAQPSAAQRLPQLHELPDHLRREIPQLTIGGAMYSEIPTQRMLIVNSQVFREGDQPYQGLILEEIRLKSAVFSYRGQRYSVNY